MSTVDTSTISFWFLILSTPIFRQTSICWKRREDLPAPLASATSTLSLASVATRGSGGGGGGTPRGSLGGGGAHNECLCVEIFGSNCLGFHNTPNTLLHEIVTKLQVLRIENTPELSHSYLLSAKQTCKS